MEFREKKVEDAIELGLKELGLTKEQAVITVLDQGGFLRKARVDIVKKVSESQQALEFIEAVAEKMGIVCTADMVEDEEGVTISISGKDTGAIIGYRGDVLDAVQYLGSLILNASGGKHRRLTLDCENYRAKREEILRNLARKLADKATRTGKRVRLEPMNPCERRIIHSALQANEDVETLSEGVEPNRYIIIKPKNETKFEKRPYNRDRNFDRNKRSGSRDFNRDRGGREFNRDRYDRERGDRRPPRDGSRDRRSGARPAKKEPFSLGFGSYLGNSKSYLEDNVDDKKDE